MGYYKVLLYYFLSKACIKSYFCPLSLKLSYFDANVLGKHTQAILVCVGQRKYHLPSCGLSAALWTFFNYTKTAFILSLNSQYHDFFWTKVLLLMKVNLLEPCQILPRSPCFLISVIWCIYATTQQPKYIPLAFCLTISQNVETAELANTSSVTWILHNKQPQWFFCKIEKVALC